MRTRSSFAQALAVILCFAVLLPDSLRAKTGSVIVTYDYDAFGILIHSTGTTPNNYLFAGEQFDPDLGLYYNRARYLNVSTDRFWTLDRFEGNQRYPFSLHKYLYAEANPVLLVDRGGRSATPQEGLWGTELHNQIYLRFEAWLGQVGHEGITNSAIATILGIANSELEGVYDRPDLVDLTTGEVYEIKPVWLYLEAEGDLIHYTSLLTKYDPTASRVWSWGVSFDATGTYPLAPNVQADVEPTEDGMILYTIRTNIPILVPREVLEEGVEGFTNLERAIQAAEEAELAEVGSELAVAPI